MPAEIVEIEVFPGSGMFYWRCETCRFVCCRLVKHRWEAEDAAQAHNTRERNNADARARLATRFQSGDAEEVPDRE